jgi:hypothetical protein
MESTSVQLQRKLLRVKARAWGIAFGLTLGLGLFVATNILVLKGGAVVGPHLGLLGVFLPGYRVTFAGSLIGFVYMFVIGYGFGRLVGHLYNGLTATGR